MKNTTTKVFGVDKIVLYPILKDTENVYEIDENGVEIPNAKSIEITFLIDTNNLLENEVIVDVYSKVKRLTFNIVASNYAEIDIDSEIEYQLVAKVAGCDDDGSLFVNLMKCEFGNSSTQGKGIYTNKKFDKNGSIAELLLDITLSNEVIDISPVKC